jgi:hypothetical protein
MCYSTVERMGFYAEVKAESTHMTQLESGKSPRWGDVPATMNALPFDGRAAANGTLLSRVLHVTRLALAIHEEVAL